MPPLADAGDVARGPVRLRHKSIHQRGLSDAGVAEQHRHLVDQQRRNGVERIVAARDRDGQVQIGELRGEGLRRREVGLGQAQNRRQPARVGGDQRAFDEAGARRRVGERDHDQQLVGVGDDHALGGIGVVRGAPQHRSAVPAPHDARQGVRASGEVAHQADVVADHD